MSFMLGIIKIIALLGIVALCIYIPFMLAKILIKFGIEYYFRLKKMNEEK